MRTRVAAVVAAMLVAGLAGTAHAGVVIGVSQSGPNVVATLSGTIDLTDLSPFQSPSVDGGEVDPTFALLSTGPTAGGIGDQYTGISGPTNFGTGGFTFASSGSGDLASIAGNSEVINVPHGYLSGQTLSGSATFDGTTIAGLGLASGSYVWTWGTGAHADSLTVNIAGSAVPEPSSWVMLGTAVAGGWIAARHRRRSR